MLDTKMRPMITGMRDVCSTCPHSAKAEDFFNRCSMWMSNTDKPIPFGEVYILRQIVKECAREHDGDCNSLKTAESAAYIAARQYMVSARP